MYISLDESYNWNYAEQLDIRIKKANPRLMACTLDYDMYPDDETQSSRYAYEYATRLLAKLKEWNRVDSVYTRVSSSGHGRHLLIFIPLATSIMDMREMRESLFGLRLLLGDDLGRISADINRFHATHEQDTIMQLFGEKYDSETKQRVHCGAWEKII